MKLLWRIESMETNLKHVDIGLCSPFKERIEVWRYITSLCQQLAGRTHR